MGGFIQDFRNYAGPVARAYELSKAPVAVIVGPTGGGKSQASARKCLRVALNQHPSPIDGWRKGRVVCVGPTYRILWDTAIPSFKKVWPEALGGNFQGAKGDPAEYVIDIPHESGRGGIHLEVWFRATRDEDLETFVRGKETTAWWFPEMDTMPQEDLLGLAINRVGRYPEPDDRPDPEQYPDLPPSYGGVFGDSNAPVIGSWFHRLFYLERAHADGFFRQPDAFSPDAENMHNLRKIDPEYYQKMASKMSEYDINRLLRCKPGWSRFGKPVHEHFDDQRHVAKGPLEVDPSLHLRIGVDAGNTLKPAATFSQRSWSGQKRVLAEISPKDRQMDLAEFSAEVRRLKDTLFREVQSAQIIVDPSAKGQSTTNRQISYAQLLQAHTGIPVRLAPSNDPGLRRSAVDNLLKRSAGPGEPAILICPRGGIGLIEALTGGYRFKKSGDAYSPQPEKNDHSHEAEAFQYDCLDEQGIGPIGGGFIPPRVGMVDHPGVILD